MDSRCVQGLFIGYDKNSPAYLVYYADTEKVQKHRLVKFTNKTDNDKETQTHGLHMECHDREVYPKVLDMMENDGEMHQVKVFKVIFLRLKLNSQAPSM